MPETSPATSKIGLTIGFVPQAGETAAAEHKAQQLFNQFTHLDEVEQVSRLREVELPEHSMAAGAFLVGLLTAEVSLDNAQKVLRFLADRLRGSAIELEVEAHGKRLAVKAANAKELQMAIAAAERFIGTDKT